MATEYKLSYTAHEIDKRLMYIGTIMNSNILFDKFPTEGEVNALSHDSYFTTKGSHEKNDGLACTYHVSTTNASYYVPYGNKYVRPIMSDSNKRDILVDYYGIRRDTTANHAASNSAILDNLLNGLSESGNQGFTLLFGSGHYYFENPIVFGKHMMVKGTCSNALKTVAAVNYGSFLHFPNLANGQACIDIPGGVIQDLSIIGNESICDVVFTRENVGTGNDIVTLTDKGTTYGIKLSSWGFTVQNVQIKNCTYGIYAETSNALISHVDIRKCKTGISIGNDIRVTNVQVTDIMVGVELRGALAAATNIRGDSVGKHLIESKNGKCILSNIDGDFCLGSLIHYGGGSKYIHLGTATNCMGRIAVKTAHPRSTSYDLNSIEKANYEYCSYISIADDTQVFGGHIELVNTKARVTDSASEYMHSNAAICIGERSTVKDVTIVCDVSSGADVEYFNKNVIKSFAGNYAEDTNDVTNYVTNFDGLTIEDIGFVTPSGLVRTVRKRQAEDRKLITFSTNDVSPFMDMLETVGVSIPSINLNVGVYEYGRFAAAGTEYNGDSPLSVSFRTKNYLRVQGGRTIAMYYAKGEWNDNNAGLAMQIVQYDSAKNIIVERTDMNPYASNKSTFTLNENTMYIRFCRPMHNAAIQTPLADIQIAIYYIEDYVNAFISPEPTILGDKKVLNLQNAVLPSSTTGSTKKFMLIVNDAGVVSAVEIK